MVKKIGRTIEKNGGYWFALSGTGIEFEFTGKKLSIVIGGDDNTKVEEMTAVDGGDVAYARIAIYVDGERVIEDMVKVPEKEYELINSTENKTAVVQVIKLSEAPMSSVMVKEIKTEDGAVIKATPEKKTKIEIIGDSITCGYGVDVDDPLIHFTTETEDVTKSYSYLTAKALDADYSMVSYSGHGIISGYTEGDEPLEKELVPPYYKMTAFSRGLMEGEGLMDIPWDFNAYVPDIVVINLGTNDDSYCRDVVERQEKYCTELVKFIKVVRENNKAAQIVMAFGIMGDRIFPYIEKAADLYKQETGDEKISCLWIKPQVDEDGFGADYHPCPATHIRAAKTLSEFLKQYV